ncbi:MAG TPA: hypothetical protein VLW06_13765, partial [Terriglobales bacterium]|nr:hypothetical protein [Terriglobales bacterium]
KIQSQNPKSKSKVKIQSQNPKSKSKVKIQSQNPKSKSKVKIPTLPQRTREGWGTLAFLIVDRSIDQRINQSGGW